MAVGDIYRLDAYLEAPSGPASFGLYYKEAAIRSGVERDTDSVAQAWDAANGANLLAILSNDWKSPSIIVRKVFGDPVPMARNDNGVQIGGVVGPSLPANNAMLVGFHQSLFAASSDGRIFIPGVAEPQTTVGVLNAAFLGGALKTFTDQLITQLAEISAGTGRWDLGVISAKIRDLVPPAKDWAGAFAPVVSITRNPIIATQRRRQTRVRGRSL